MEIISKFMEEMGDALSSDRKLTSCDRDMQIYTDVQKNRLQKKGLVLDYDFISRGLNENGREHGIEWRDGHYVAKMQSASCTYNKILKKGKKTIYKSKMTASVWAVVMNYIQGENIENDMYSCPNCGNPALIKDLTGGCKYCGTSFRMEELYPKISNYNIVYDPSRKPKEFWLPVLKFTGIFTGIIWVSVPVLAVLVVILMVIIMVITSNKIPRDALEKIFMGGLSGFAGILSTMFMGAPFWGFLLALIPTFVKLGKEGAKSAMLLGTFNSHKMFEDVMKAHDQEYMQHYFMGKTVSKMKTAIFSDDARTLPFYEGEQLPEEMQDIVDVFFRGAMEYKNVSVEDNIATVDADVYTEVLTERDGKAKNSERVFHIRMKKNLSKKTALDFSVTKFMCPSCGAGFDAYRHKNCPACGNAYKMEDADWVIESVQ